MSRILSRDEFADLLERSLLSDEIKPTRELLLAHDEALRSICAERDALKREIVRPFATNRNELTDLSPENGKNGKNGTNGADDE